MTQQHTSKRNTASQRLHIDSETILMSMVIRDHMLHFRQM